jgi:hypothetical protein
LCRCRNPALIGEVHCRDHASEEELARRKSLSADDVKRIRGALCVFRRRRRSRRQVFLPPKLQALILEHLDVNDLAEGLGRALDRKIRGVAPRTATCLSVTAAARRTDTPSSIAYRRPAARPRR